MKIAKLSLVAAVAVAGLSTANAQPLEQAIKDVDVSGTVVYRYDDMAEEVNDSTAANNNYKVAVSLKSKVTDDVTFNSRVVVGSNSNDDINGNNANSFATLDTSDNSDDQPTLTLTHANFAYTGLANTTIFVGKQGLETPWTNAIDSDGTEQTGTGVLGLTTMGPVTAAAGYFNQTNLTGSAYNATGTGENVVVAGLIAKFGMVNAEAWYLDHEDDFDSYFVGASTGFDAGDVKIGLDAKYSSLDLDDVSSENVSNWEAEINAAMGIFKVGYAYAESDEDGAAIVNALAKNGQIGYSVNLADTTDAEMNTVYASAQVLPKLNVLVRFDEIKDQDTADTDDHKELWTQVTYDHSKNLSTYVRFADGKDAAVDYTRGRLQVEYKF